MLRRIPPLVLLLLPLAAPAQDVAPVASPEAAAVESRATIERWYEVHERGQKTGWQKVAWAPSTWNGRPTLHDTTTIVRRSVRNMSGIKNEFSTTTTIDLERDADGTLWWQRAVTVEATRTTITELTWNGAGYDYAARVEGRSEERRISVPLDAPVMTDSEAFFGPRVRQGGVQAGDLAKVRGLDLERRGAMETELRVVAREEVVAEDGVAIACWKVVERDPESGAQTTLWIDDQGAFARLVTEGGGEYRRVTEAVAREMPVRPAEHAITSAGSPTVERLFFADKLWVTLNLRPDPLRARPDFPTSPWSRVLEVSGDDEQGWVMKLELAAHKDPALDALLSDVDRERFARELEHDVLHPCNDPRLIQTAKEVIGDETRIRAAAWKLARFVYHALDKESPEVSEATALEILEQRRGDCSEHATLFVALCRAAGIPVRKCSGYVCLGSVWGAHAWAEIWAGGWIGADPTTGEVGTGARYIFYGYDDTPGSFPGVVSSRVSGRMRLVTTGVEEGGRRFDLSDPSKYFLKDEQARRWNHVLCGVELEGLPEGWRVQMVGPTMVMVQKERFTGGIQVYADQGADLEDMGGANGTFGGHPCFRQSSNDHHTILLHSRRRILRITARGVPADLALLEQALAPTLGPAPTLAQGGEPVPSGGGEPAEEEQEAPVVPAPEPEPAPR